MIAMTRHDPSLAAMLGLLPSMPCPSCLQYELEFLLHCDLSYKECLPTAHCSHCGSSLVLDRRFTERLQRALEAKEVGLCPHCRSGRSRVTLICRLGSRRAAAIGLCMSCRDEFTLAASA